MTLARLLEHEDAYTYPKELLPRDLSTETMSFFIHFGGVLDALQRSVIVALVTLVLSLAIGTPAGYALARFAFRGADTLRLSVVGTRAFPIVILSIPLAVIFIRWGIDDTVLGVSIAHTALALPFVVLTTASVFAGVSPELEEAAMTLGCSRAKAFVKVALPLALPGLAASAIFVFIVSWNEVFAASLLTLRHRTLPAEVLSLLEGAPLNFRFAGGFFLMAPSRDRDPAHPSLPVLDVGKGVEVMADVRFHAIRKTFGKVTAVDDVDLEVADGDFVVLLGPSGCGKTTLLRCLAGLEKVDGGRVLIGGRDATDLPPRRRRIAMVFQSYAVFPHLKLFDNIAFGLRMQKEPKAVIRERVDFAAKLLHIEDLLDRYPSQISGGQRQRVAVARAIATKADVLLMDEPLSNLDALLRMEMRAELKALLRQLGTTTIYVTHDQVEALSMGDRIAVMNAGRIVQLDSPLAVYDYPADTFVGGFVGTPPMNFLAAEISRNGGRPAREPERRLVPARRSRRRRARGAQARRSASGPRRSSSSRSRARA